MYDIIQKIPTNLLNLIYLGIFISLMLFIRNLIIQYLKKRILDAKQFRIYKIYINYIFLFFIILFILPTFLPALREIATVLSIFGAGVLLVFKELLLNLVTFFYLVIRRPFKVGDRIRINDYYGDVLDIRLIDFTLLQLYPQKLGGQSSGRVIHIPNSYVLLYPLSNFSKEFAFNWLEIKIPLTINSDWQKTENIILKIIHKIQNPPNEKNEKIKLSYEKYAIQYQKLNPKTFIDYSKGSIIISLRFLCEPKDQRQIKDQFWREFLQVIKKQKSIRLETNFDNLYEF
jgi:small-conductance mechanosensitive channel